MIFDDICIFNDIIWYIKYVYDNNKLYAVLYIYGFGAYYCNIYSCCCSAFTYVFAQYLA